MENLTIKDKFYKPFENIKSRRGRGGTYDYVTWKDVADRMNDVFGMLWSSEVRSIDVTDTSVILRVSVCAKDPVSLELYCQEGYGGAAIRDGDEPGTAHKAAYSKAFRDACKKWGMGLHLEDDEGSSNSTMPKGYSGYETAKTVSNVPNKPPTTPAMPNVPSPTVPTPDVPTTQTPAAITTKVDEVVAPVQQALPSIPSMPSISTPPSPVSGSAPVLTTNIPTPPAPQTSLGDSSPDSPGTINNVQEMAIKNLARLSNIEDAEKLLEDLQTKSDSGLTRQIANISDLSYTEAVCVIKAAKNMQ